MPGIIPVTIANGASVSGVINIGGTQFAGLFTPAAWTAAAITFQMSVDGVTFVDVYDSLGNEIAIISAAIPTATARYIDFTAGAWSPPWFTGTYLKLRSGTSAAAVNQGAARALNLAVV